LGFEAQSSFGFLAVGLGLGFEAQVRPKLLRGFGAGLGLGGATLLWVFGAGLGLPGASPGRSSSGALVLGLGLEAQSSFGFLAVGLGFEAPARGESSSGALVLGLGLEAQSSFGFVAPGASPAKAPPGLWCWAWAWRHNAPLGFRCWAWASRRKPGPKLLWGLVSSRFKARVEAPWALVLGLGYKC
jgi:hypothetical protein